MKPETILPRNLYPPTRSLVEVPGGRVQFFCDIPAQLIFDVAFSGRGGRRFLGRIQYEVEGWKILCIERQPVDMAARYTGWHEAMGFLLTPQTSAEVAVCEAHATYAYVSLIDPTRHNAEPERRIFTLKNAGGEIRQVDLVTNNLDPAFIFAHLAGSFDLSRWGICACTTTSEPF